MLGQDLQFLINVVVMWFLIPSNLGILLALYFWNRFVVMTRARQLIRGGKEWLMEEQAHLFLWGATIYPSWKDGASAYGQAKGFGRKILQAQQQRVDLSKEESLELKWKISEMTSNVMQLCIDIATRDLEVLKPKQKIMHIERSLEESL
jgi:hypothetical protein